MSFQNLVIVTNKKKSRPDYAYAAYINKVSKKGEKITITTDMMIGYDIWVRFTMEHFPLRQSMNLTTSYFCSRHIVQSIGSFTLQKVQKSLYLAGIFYQAYY
jgi:hypothetical protein